MSGRGATDLRSPLLRRSTAIFAIRFFPLAAMAAAGIIFSRSLPVSANGAYQQVWVYLAVFIAIAAAGLPPLMLTHTAASVDSWFRAAKSRHILLASGWTLLLAVMLTGVFHFRGSFAIAVAPALFIVQVGILLAETYLIIHRRFLIALIASIAYAVGFCALHVMAIRGSFGLKTMLWLTAALGLLRFLALAIDGVLTYSKGRPDAYVQMPPAVRKQWLQLGIYDVSQITFRWIDKVIVSLFVPSAYYAIYQNGTQDIPFMNTLLSAVGNTVLQQMAGGEKTTDERLKLVRLSGSLLARIVFPVFFFLLFFRHEALVFVLTDKYASSVPLFAIAIMTLPLRAYNHTAILQHLNQVKLINWGALLDLSIALLLAYPLYHWLGLAGLALAFVISTYIQVGFYFYHTSRLLRCSVLQLIPWGQWLVMFIVFGSVLIGLHEALARNFGLKQTLFLGFAGTAAVIIAAMAPVIFAKKSHG